MQFSRNKIITKYPWINKENKLFITSADYDGLICASFLHHFLNWTLVGYYDLETLWLSDKAKNNRSNIIWVDLNILPQKGRTIGGHIVSIDNTIPSGFQSSCNPNLLLNLNHTDFKKKYPFSTLLFLMWLHNIYPPNELTARMLTVHADAVWLKYQHYNENIVNWTELLEDYDWNKIIKGIDTKIFEKRIDQLLYPTLINMGAVSSKSKLKGVYFNTQCRQYQCNPDWDEDIILDLFNLFGNIFHWSPPEIPNITTVLHGKRKKISISKVRDIGLDKFINKNKVFSYAIPSPRIFNYTSFKI